MRASRRPTLTRKYAGTGGIWWMRRSQRGLLASAIRYAHSATESATDATALFTAPGMKARHCWPCCWSVTVVAICWAPMAAAYRPFDGTDADVAEPGEVELEV